MRLRQQSNEVLHADETIVRVGRPEVATLQQALARSTRGRSRICAHRGSSNTLHEMIITLGRGSYIRPHRHFGKCESFHIIEGELDVVIFDEDGNVADLVRMGPYASERCFFYRMADPLFHTVLVRTETVIFHETTNGPFVREDTEFAAWAPAENETTAADGYARGLVEKVNTFTLAPQL
ncbi:MAG TPA: cupin fold metalloprotein, WbuC family [Verrucomicrobiales bacterium]|nr:cupin fold metalloprotein, WbuC family [Verrucomicrobiales bacterium]